MNIRLLRHATIVVDWGDVSILVDPMLAEQESLDPIPNAANAHRIPMLPLPLDDALLDLGRPRVRMGQREPSQHTGGRQCPNCEAPRDRPTPPTPALEFGDQHVDIRPSLVGILAQTANQDRLDAPKHAPRSSVTATRSTR